MNDDLFTDERLTERAIEQITHARNWLNYIERDVTSDKCVNAQLLLDLADATTKLSYGIGMMNSVRLREYAAPDSMANNEVESERT